MTHVYAQNLLGLLILIVVSASDHGLSRLVEAFRVHGHKAAKINPLLPQKPVLDSVPEIDMLRGIIQGPLNTSGGKWKPAGRRRSARVQTLNMCRVFVTSVQTVFKEKKHLTNHKQATQLGSCKSEQIRPPGLGGVSHIKAE